jgi:hypothetical protein
MKYFKNSSQEVNKVYKTNDLEIFNQIEGNRPANPQHVNRLSQSINENGILCNPILVNEKMQVIDGQHRLLAAKKQQSEIYYIVIDGYGLDDVHTLNLNQKNWSKRDFLDGYAKMGLEPYVKLKAFCKKHKDFTVVSSIQLCSQLSGWGSFTRNTKRSKDKKENNIFEQGTWKGGDFNIGEDLANKIELLKPYYKGFNRGSFVSVMLSLLLYKKDIFDFNEFMHKIRLQPTALVDCTTVEQYKMLIEDIYNYRSRNKVNLRY